MESIFAVYDLNTSTTSRMSFEEICNKYCDVDFSILKENLISTISVVVKGKKVAVINRVNS